MNNTRRMITSVLEIVIGAGLVIGVKLLDGDSLWLGMGGALIAVALIQFAFSLRYRSDASYRESVDVEAKDERSAFIRAQAWSWAGVAFTIVCGILTLVLMILGKEQLYTITGSGVCLLMVLYWISFLILKRKT